MLSRPTAGKAAGCKLFGVSKVYGSLRCGGGRGIAGYYDLGICALHNNAVHLAFGCSITVGNLIKALLAGLSARFFAPVLLAAGRATSVCCQGFRFYLRRSVHPGAHTVFRWGRVRRQGVQAKGFCEFCSAAAPSQHGFKSGLCRPVGIQLWVTKGKHHGTQRRTDRRTVPCRTRG